MRLPQKTQMPARPTGPRSRSRSGAQLGPPVKEGDRGVVPKQQHEEEEMTSRASMLLSKLDTDPTMSPADPAPKSPDDLVDVSGDEDVEDAGNVLAVQAIANPDPGPYVVCSRDPHKDTTVPNILLGEYLPQGEHHGRKIFRKVLNDAAAELTDVQLYYWDGRDCGDFEGWWFGSEPGSIVAWAFCKSSSLLPPKEGWAAPCQGPDLDQLVVMPKDLRAEEELSQLERRVSQVMRTAEKGLEQARSEVSSGSPESLARAEQTLNMHATPLCDLQHWLMEGQNGASERAAAMFEQFALRLQRLRGDMDKQMERVMGERAAVEAAAKVKRLEDEDRKVWTALSKEAQKLARRAEISIEEMQDQFEVVISAGDDDQLESMLGEAQNNIRAAKNAIKTAIQGKVSQLVTLRVREHAFIALNRELEVLQKAQTRLSEFRCVIAERLASPDAVAAPADLSQVGEEPLPGGPASPTIADDLALGSVGQAIAGAAPLDFREFHANCVPDITDPEELLQGGGSSSGSGGAATCKANVLPTPDLSIPTGSLGSLGSVGEVLTVPLRSEPTKAEVPAEDPMPPGELRPAQTKKEPESLPRGEAELLVKLKAQGLLDRAESHNALVERAAAALLAPACMDSEGVSVPSKAKSSVQCLRHKLRCVLRSARGGRLFYCCPLKVVEDGCGFQRWCGRKRAPPDMAARQPTRDRRSASRSVQRSAPRRSMSVPRGHAGVRGEVRARP